MCGCDCPQLLFPVHADVHLHQVSMDLTLMKEHPFISPKLSPRPIFLTVYFKDHQFSHIDFLSVYIPRPALGRNTMVSSMSSLERSMLLIIEVALQSSA